ncbi:MFS transporter [Nocardioides sp.]|jgi:predicted MFS family arabinose efflux permease|uniref:MFS transporter n=1 Tax=Nocardioides sp. TaxID=35761 RepID=UPI002F3FCF08
MSRPDLTHRLDPASSVQRSLPMALIVIALLVAAVGSLGAPLITSVAASYHVSLAAAQWTLTVTLLSGAVTTPLIGRLGAGPRRRTATLATMTVVTAGSVCTVLPGPFALLIVGRAAQGVGLGLGPLLMATARDVFDRRRAASVIAMLSVATTAAIGVGYPLSGLLADLGGVRAAYVAGLVATAAALLIAARALPHPRVGSRRTHGLDWVGAVLLGGALVAVLIPLGDDDLWARHAPVAGLLLGAGLVLLLTWVLVERRAASPLVDLQALRHPMVARADLAMFVGGAAMYLLLTLATRYLQTPRTAGYGFGLDTFQAGLVLVPFSIAGFVAGRMTPPLVRRLSAARTVAASLGLVAFGFLVFCIGRSTLAGPVIAVAVLGVGVGAASAAMPAMILAATPADETASAMSVNQVVRSVGFSVGSALGGLILSAHTLRGGFPTQGGYTTASILGAVLAVAAATLVVLRGSRISESGR